MEQTNSGTGARPGFLSTLCILSFIGSGFWALIPLIGSLIVIYRGYVNIKKNNIKMYKIEKQPVYSIDRRYTTGKRLDGYKEIKVPVYIDLNQKERKSIKFSLFYIVVLLLFKF